MTILSNYSSEYMSHLPLALFVMNYRIDSKKNDSVSHYMYAWPDLLICALEEWGHIFLP